MTYFEIYRSLQNRDHYVAIRAGDHREEAEGVRNSENLVFLRNIPDDENPRIAFDAEVAREHIDRNGFFAFAVTIEVRDHVS
ncbi:hypothetical protein [Afifella marina]|uniref:Uncharacterized protein n=1 Tax=Afifella marina DSM 2698 TaxID=1120955 RepID=A0A1G5NE95_AFIMA|nr:hypothetical protein [Afifella marina]MBK1623326.1 hypothetical protein [Afifella marina DSM 2698]MBK1626320.1 hypothetical protein [Afifella marina]MBK5917198.1 hypothetical protein [Afifella marina]RAI22171.1 hypothetical protein CH311_05610 [Afifella marina DSM 2698]SCZ35258.1 hypothetical protein SAMN03080610_01863 [Afifella marina DSM 2698]